MHLSLEVVTTLPPAAGSPGILSSPFWFPYTLPLPTFARNPFIDPLQIIPIWKCHLFSVGSLTMKPYHSCPPLARSATFRGWSHCANVAVKPTPSAHTERWPLTQKRAPQAASTEKHTFASAESFPSPSSASAPSPPCAAFPSRLVSLLRENLTALHRAAHRTRGSMLAHHLEANSLHLEIEMFIKAKRGKKYKWTQKHVFAMLCLWGKNLFVPTWICHEYFCIPRTNHNVLFHIYLVSFTFFYCP